MRYLDGQFEGRVVSRRAIRGHDWPARSPDLNPCDFYLWGYLKSVVYTPKPRNIAELEAAIRSEIAALDPAICMKAILDVKKRAAKCLAANEATLNNYSLIM